ncbi:MAG: argininosuccinate synthase [Chloroflexi bacterium]|jgi:argininosuccinate synthase|nr:argininosuccinate synthase [Chloroflexota bacterium]MBT3671065.1 argininosuccinate synthase [Chloroflexota bacterium]MBT4002156.1 argininosuccinate synthase [Chloroflexota bacterium]MBT4304880.1 argininosuccinate synthase [Chloroflexota bacterium]MBT4534032.1 argininosuccinate synthase [Chloroflexota bacterium]
MQIQPKPKKVVLAYSGGLDTSIIVHWLIENYGCEVICYTADLGQNEELDGLEEKALNSGASKIIIEDLRDRFLTEYVFPTMRAGATYEGKYLLGTSFARPLIAQRQVEIAEEEGADGLAHGCTGKGNDQVRFEVSAMALNPTLSIIAPWREWDILSREDAIAYADKNNIPLGQSKKSIYSRDRNIWHMSHEGGILEDPWEEPEEEMYTLSQSPHISPDTPEEIVVEFKEGTPIGFNGKKLGAVELVEQLNKIGGKHGVGRIDLVENRLVGMKSHGIYETPGGTILYKAHQELESICLDKDTLHYKHMIALRYAELVYDGKWFSPLREALDGFVTVTQKNVTGHVRMKLYKGNIITCGRKSPYSLYREDYASFGQMDIYDQQDAKGFINLWGLPMKIDALLSIEGTGKSRFRAPDYSKFKRD